jgi:hypothetical protein
LDVERLDAALREACAGSSLSPEWLRIALRAWPELQSGAMEEARSDVHALLSHQLQRVLERIGVLQRSTLAYKAKKLAVALRGKSRS